MKSLITFLATIIALSIAVYQYDNMSLALFLLVFFAIYFAGLLLTLRYIKKGA